MARMLSVSRRQEILDLIRRDGTVSVSQLSRLFGVSEVTIRTDLKVLAEKGYIVRSHGGASSPQLEVNGQLPSRVREGMLPEEKARIGATAARLVYPGDVISLDSSTTALQLARRVKSIRNLTVVTNSLEVMIELSGIQSLTVVGVGGILSETTRSFLGPMAEEGISKIHVNKAFISPKGVSVTFGLSDYSPLEGQIRRKMMDVADKVIMLADHSKFNQLLFSSFVPLDSVDMVVTDAPPPPEFADFLSKKGIEIVVAAGEIYGAVAAE